MALWAQRARNLRPHRARSAAVFGARMVQQADAAARMRAAEAAWSRYAENSPDVHQADAEHAWARHGDRDGPPAATAKAAAAARAAQKAAGAPPEAASKARAAASATARAAAAAALAAVQALLAAAWRTEDAAPPAECDEQPGTPPGPCGAAMRIVEEQTAPCDRCAARCVHPAPHAAALRG